MNTIDLNGQEYKKLWTKIWIFRKDKYFLRYATEENRKDAYRWLSFLYSSSHSRYFW
ncbi:hypothetical protein [Francisella frigiditurris]|uniref:hypothetical protein n=1 Tax=Francisella frigiditurris TaxID=1542390 RepID=UPI000AE01C43|nr:hypothetical protein [Francisella frigiditurris]